MTDWQKVREAYEARERAVQEICDAHGIGPTALYRKLREENWPLRNELGALRKGSRKKRPRGPKREDLVDRLYKAFERQMGEFEARLGAAAQAGVDEKDARTLGSLARTLEKLIGLRGENGGVDGNLKTEVDIERLREELARRLERLCPKGKTE